LSLELGRWGWIMWMIKLLGVVHLVRGVVATRLPYVAYVWDARSERAKSVATTATRGVCVIQDLFALLIELQSVSEDRTREERGVCLIGLPFGCSQRWTDYDRWPVVAKLPSLKCRGKDALAKILGCWHMWKVKCNINTHSTSYIIKTYLWKYFLKYGTLTWCWCWNKVNPKGDIGLSEFMVSEIVFGALAALFGMWHKQQLRAALSTRSQPHVMIGSWVCWVTHGTCYCSTAQKVIKFLCTYIHLRGYVSFNPPVFLLFFHPWGPSTVMDERVKAARSRHVLYVAAISVNIFNAFLSVCQIAVRYYANN